MWQRWCNRVNITVIIPTYNEQCNISETIRKLQFAFEDVKHHCMTILVFDSCSIDNTVKSVQNCQDKWANVILLTEPKKTGLGSAYAQAMQYAIGEMKSDAVVEFDADGSHSAEDLIKMINKLDEGYDVIIGSRYVKNGRVSVDWPFYRLLVSKVGNWIARFMLTTQYKDFTSGFRITKTSILKKINLKKLFSLQYGYKIHLLWLLHKAKANIAEVPITFIDRTQGVSKLPKNTIYDSLYVLFRIRVREFMCYFKVCFCGAVGMLLQIIAFNILIKKISPVLSNTIAVELAIVCNFLPIITLALPTVCAYLLNRHFLCLRKCCILICCLVSH